VAGAVETAAAEEIDKDAFVTFLLMISSAAWKSLRTNRSGFPTVPAAPTAITQSQDPRETNTTFLLLPLIDDLLKGYKKPEDLIGENGLLKQLTKQLLERAMSAELTAHVGYEKHDAAGDNTGNSRNGTSAKTIKGSFGEMPIEVPRDRKGTFEPQIIEKHQTRFTGFDENIISLYARGLSTREIQQNLKEIYQVEVSPALISNVTDEVIEEVKAWQNRQLDAVYPIVYMDAIQFKVRDSKTISTLLPPRPLATPPVPGGELFPPPLPFTSSPPPSTFTSSPPSSPFTSHPSPLPPIQLIRSHPQ
jgi:hypothetical protein